MSRPQEKKANQNAEALPASVSEARRKYRRGRIYVRTGQVLMLAGVLIAIVHWLAHIEAFGPGQPPGWLDLVAGYPMGGVLLIAGAIIAGQKPK